MNAIISALGARSPVGLDAEQTAMGIRFSHLSPRRTRFEDSSGQPVGMSLLSALPDEMEGKERMVALAVPALVECAAMDRRASTSPSQGRPIVLLGCPAPRPGFAATDAQEVLRAVVRDAGVDACPERSAAFAVGHAGFAVALERALSELAGAQGAPIFVGGVDSYHDAQAAAFLDGELRLRGGDNTDGFVPAEGAGFLAVRSGGAGRAHRFGEVVLAASDLERTVSDGKPNLARAMTELVARAALSLAAARGEAAAQRVHDGQRLGWYLRTTNRERHRAREEAFVMTRSPRLFDPDGTHIDELAEHLGDAGAASGALLAVFVCQGFASGYAPHGTAVISLASDGPERGIAVLRGAAEGASEPRLTR